MTIGSIMLPVLIGIALGDLFHGLPINKEGNFTGSFLDLLTPYGIWFGLTLLALSLAHGSTYLSLKTTGEVQQRARGWLGPCHGSPLLCVTRLFHLDPRAGRPRRPARTRSRSSLFCWLLGLPGPYGTGISGWVFRATTATIAATLGFALRVALSECHGLEHELCLQFDGVQRLFCHLLLDCDDRGRRHIYTAGPGLSGLELLRFPRPGQGPGLRGHNEAPVDSLPGGARKGAPGKMTRSRPRLGRAEPLVGSMTNDF